MTNYTLSIEDRVKTEGKVTERVVMVDGDFTCEKVYNPNAETKGFLRGNITFDTPFSIVHPFRDVAKEIALNYLAKGGVGVPTVKYDGSVNDAQRQLFENIFKREYEVQKPEIKPIAK